MNNRRIELSTRAEITQRAIEEYVVERFSKAVAARVMQLYREKLRLLAKNPELGRAEPHIENTSLRSYLLHENTRVYYTYTDAELNVLLFWGTHQHPDKLEALLDNR